MKIEGHVPYVRRYLPSKQAKKIREDILTAVVEVEIPEISSNDAPVVLVVTDFDTVVRDDFGDEEIREYNENLYRPWREQSGDDKGRWKKPSEIPDRGVDHYRWNIDKPFVKGVSIEVESFESDSKCASSASFIKQLSRFLLIDGKVWILTGEPFYTVTRFGFGDIGLFIDYPWLDAEPRLLNKDREFPADKRELLNGLYPDRYSGLHNRNFHEGLHADKHNIRIMPGYTVKLKQDLSAYDGLYKFNVDKRIYESTLHREDGAGRSGRYEWYEFWFSKDGDKYHTRVYASGKAEAVGRFCMSNPEISYGKVCETPEGLDH